VADAAQLIRRLGVLQALRMPHESTWRDCFDYTHPLRGSGLQSQDLTAQSAQNRKARILDGTGTDSARILASGIVGGMTPANSAVVQDGTPRREPGGIIWFDESSEALWQNIHNGTFDANAFELALDIVDAGWGVLYVDEDRPMAASSSSRGRSRSASSRAAKAGGPATPSSASTSSPPSRREHQNSATRTSRRRPPARLRTASPTSS
jgi:hypothetical protein